MAVVLIRVDATPEIGAGHLMRMIALGQLLRDHGHDVHLATVTDPSTLPAASHEFTIHLVPGGVGIASSDDARDLVTLTRRLGAEWVVLDGYAFETEYQRTVRAAGARLMSVADRAACHFVSDVVLDQNHGAESKPYSAEPYTVKCLGTKYLMLRREFRTATPRAQRSEPPRSVLVSLGGGASAAMEALIPLASILAQVDVAGLRFRLITGMLAAIPESLSALARSQPERFDVVRHVESMAAEMNAADAAISSGGSTTWELMRMRVPFLAVSLNAPQDAFLAALERDGLCAYLGPHTGLRVTDAHRVEGFLADAELRTRMVRAGSAVVDPQRSSEALLQIFSRG